jgi:hypothetical protein
MISNYSFPVIIVRGEEDNNRQTKAWASFQSLSIVAASHPFSKVEVDMNHHCDRSRTMQ